MSPPDFSGTMAVEKQHSRLVGRLIDRIRLVQVVEVHIGK
jgi:hypothetical protein